MQLRVYAMYGRSRRILLLLGCCFAVSSGVCIVLITKVMLAEIGEIFNDRCSLFLLSVKKLATSDPFSGLFPVHFCASLDLPSYYALYWVPLLSFEVIVFALVLNKGYWYYRQYKVDGLKVNLTTLLVRDSVAYFVMYVPGSKKRGLLTNLRSVFAGFLMNELFWKISGVCCSYCSPTVCY